MKKTKKVNFLVWISLLFVLGFACICVGCKDSDATSSSSSSSSIITPPAEDNSPVTLNISESTVNLTVGEYKQLFVTYSKVIDGLTLEWSSQNDSVALVKKGTVEAISEGTTTIKAKYGDAEITCEVKVTFGETSPQIKLGTTNAFCINVGDEYAVSPKVLFNSREFTDGTFTYKSTDTSVLTVKDNVVTAVKTGTAQIVVEGSWRGKTVANAPALQTVLDIEVTDIVDIYLSGKEQSSYNIITLYAKESFNGVTYDRTANFVPVVRKNGEVVTSAEYTVTSGNTTVATYDETTRTVAGVGYGETVLTVQTELDGKLHSKTFIVKVLRPEMVVAKSIKYMSSYKGTLKAENGFAEQTVMEHIIGNNDVEIVDAYQDGVALKVQDNRIYGLRNQSDGSYETQLTLGTATEVYHVTATVYGVYITQPRDLEVFVLSGDRRTVNLYAELGQDINAQGYTLPIPKLTVTSSKEADGFTGVFNGNGYAIKGLTLPSNQGLFGSVTAGMIKNVAFTNWTYTDGYSSESGILGVHVERTKLSNVYVKMNELPKCQAGASVLASYKIRGGSFKYVYVEYVQDIGAVTYDNCYSALGAIYPADEPTFDNCIVVSRAPLGVCKTESSRLQVAYGSNVGMDRVSGLVNDIKTGFATANNKAVESVNVTSMSMKGVRQYDTVTDFQKDYMYTQPILSSFTTNYWTVSENKLLWGKDNTDAVEYGTIRLDLGIVAGRQVNGITVSQIKATAGDTVELPKNLTCMGYVFKGWSYVGTLLEGGKIVGYDGKPMTVVAVWEKADNVIQTPII